MYVQVFKRKIDYRQRFDSYVPVVYGAARIVRLQSESPVRYNPVGIGFRRFWRLRFCPVDYGFAIDFYDDALSFYDDMFRKPDVIGRRRCADIFHRKQTARAVFIIVCVVDLSLKSLDRPAFFLVLGVKVYAAVGAGLGHNIDLQLEIREYRVFYRTDVEQVTSRPARYDHAVANAETVGVLARFPAI